MCIKMIIFSSLSKNYSEFCISKTSDVNAKSKRKIYYRSCQSSVNTDMMARGKWISTASGTSGLYTSLAQQANENSLMS